MTGDRVATQALCWRLERRDGAGLAATSHDQAMPVDGIVHDPSPAITPAAIDHRLGLEPQSAEVSGVLGGAALAEDDLALGRWDGAAARLVAAPWDGVGTSTLLVAGEVGVVGIANGAFSADLRGTAAKLDAPPCPTTSPECRAELGDRHCRVAMAARIVRAVVTSSAMPAIGVDVTVDGRFVGGTMRVLSGALTGLRARIGNVGVARVDLAEALRRELAAGDRIELEEGCDKRFATCADRFANAANFRGEPHLPGNDLLTRYPGG